MCFSDLTLEIRPLAPAAARRGRASRLVLRLSPFRTPGARKPSARKPTDSEGFLRRSESPVVSLRRLSAQCLMQKPCGHSHRLCKLECGPLQLVGHGPSRRLPFDERRLIYSPSPIPMLFCRKKASNRGRRIRVDSGGRNQRH